MSIIEQAAKRLEQLQRAGVDVPWSAAGYPQSQARDGEMDRGAQRLTPVASAAAERSDLATSRAAGARPGDAGNDSASTRVAASKLVELDLVRLAQEGYLVPGAIPGPLADEFRVIKRPLLKNAALEGSEEIKRGNLIQVTSALPNEGKTFCAINLALSMAMELDHSVLLVDTDVTRPAAMMRLGVESSKGLIDILRNPQIALSDVVLRTNVPKLTLLPVGTADVNSTELFASAAMESLLDELASRYEDRIVVFDAPPLLATTQSRVLASRVGQVLVVVESGRTNKATVAQAFATIQNCAVVMSVLNKHADASSSGYSY
jgi:protein-tyrosine kinase